MNVGHQRLFFKRLVTHVTFLWHRTIRVLSNAAWFASDAPATSPMSGQRLVLGFGGYKYVLLTPWPALLAP